MKPLLSTTLFCLMCMLLVGAIAPSSSLATPLWRVGAKVLLTTLETEPVSETGRIKIVVVGRTEVSCELSFRDLLIGGAPGTDEFTTFTPFSCTDSTSFCSVTSASAQRLDFYSTLSESGSKYFDLIKPIAIAFTLSGSSCAVAGKYVLEEEVEGEFKNIQEELVLPHPELKGTFLVVNDLTNMEGYHGELEGTLPFPGIGVVN
jgi:hypothetical protein